MVEAGIVDPTKVTRSALQNAASVASTVLTTEALVVLSPSRNRLHPQAVWAAAWVVCINPAAEYRFVPKGLSNDSPFVLCSRSFSANDFPTSSSYNKAK